MATSLRCFVLLKRIGSSNTCSSIKRYFSSSNRRLLLSETYACNEAWKKHLEDPNLQQITLNEFGYQVKDQLEKSGFVSAIDMNILTHHLTNMDDDEADFVEGLLARYSVCQSSYPRSDSTSHAIVRGFLSKESDGASRLVHILSERLQYNFFPDHYSLNLLLDRLIEKKDWASAARIAYHTMLQEELDVKVSHSLLCLYAAVQRLLQGPLADLAAPIPEKDPEEEEDWIKVKYIRWPVYDDHFDIKDERFLLGKTLHTLAKLSDLNMPEELSASLSILGSAIHHKFSRGLADLENIVASPSGTISQYALEVFSQSLEDVQARDPEEPEVEIALRTVDDLIHRCLPTTVEKAEYQTRLGQLKEQLTSQNKIDTNFELVSSVSQLVTSQLPNLESLDIEQQIKKFEKWTSERGEELQRQIEDLQKAERLEEMKKQVKELQEQEELLSYFDFEDEIRLTFMDDDLEKDENLTIAK